MKKLLGSIILVIALWAGTTAFVGNSMQKNLQQQINYTNNLYTEYGIQYNIQHYKKSFLHSQVQIAINIIDPLLLELLKPSVKLPILLDYTIDHGPLFFKNGLSFGVAQVHKELFLSRLLKDDAKKEFLTVIKDDIKITNDITLSFKKNASYKLQSDAIKVDKDGKIFNMSPLNIQGQSNIETFKGKSTMHISSLLFKEKESQNGLEIENLTMNFNIDEFINQSFMLGLVKIHTDKLMIKDKNNPLLPEMNIALNLQMKNEKETEDAINSMVEGEIDFKNTTLPKPFPKLQQVHIKIDVKNLGLKGMLIFQDTAKEMQEAQTQLFSQITQPLSSKAFEEKFLAFQEVQKKMINKMILALNNLLIKDKSTLAYTLDIQTKDKKESKVSTEIKYVGDLEFKGNIEEVVLKIQEKIFDSINFDIKMKLNQEHIKTFPDVNILNQQIQMAVAQGFVKEVNGNYILEGYYKDKELIVNDNNLTATVLPFLMMANQVSK
jgi:hypothetical protein